MKSFRKEQLGKVRTKIVATVGPASSDPAVLGQMVEAGVDVFRLNFSHGTHDEHTATLAGDPADRGRRRGSSSRSCRTCAAPRSGWGRSRATWSPATSTRSSSWSTEPGRGDDPHHLTCYLPRRCRTTWRSGRRVLFADGTVAMDVVARERAAGRG